MCPQQARPFAIRQSLNLMTIGKAKMRLRQIPKPKASQSETKAAKDLLAYIKQNQEIEIAFN